MGIVEQQSKYYDYVNDVVFDLLCEFDRVCRKNDIKYYLAYGTLLGAARDQDIIPWDDDVDILITTDELKKLVAHKDDFSQRYRLLLPEDFGEGVYYNSVVHVIDQEIRFRLESEESQCYSGFDLHPHLDLFHLAPYPGGFRGRLYGIRMCAVYGMANAYRQYDTSHYTLFMRVSSSILKSIGRLFGLKRIWRMIIDGIVENDHLQSGLLHNNGGDILEMFRIYNADDFRCTTELPIRNRLFLAPIGYDSILRKKYGDYMQLPPNQDRIWKLAQLECLQQCAE